MITPILRKPVGRKKTTRNFGDFGKIAKILTCLIENRGVGVTTTLGTSEFIYPNGCFKHTNHHPGREFPCEGTFTLFFKQDFTHEFAKSLPFGIAAKRGRRRANLWGRDDRYLSYQHPTHRSRYSHRPPNLWVFFLLPSFRAKIRKFSPK